MGDATGPCYLSGTDFPQAEVSSYGGATFDLPETVYEGEHVEIEASLSGGVSGVAIGRLIDAGATTLDGSTSMTIYPDMRGPVRASIDVPGLPITQGSYGPGASWSGKAKFVLPTTTLGKHAMYSGLAGSGITARKADGSLTRHGEVSIGCLASPNLPKIGEYTVLPAVQHADLSATGTTRIAKLGVDAPIGPAPFAIDHDRRTDAVTGTLGATTATIPFRLFGSVPATATVRFTPGAVTGTLDGGVLTAQAPLAVTVTDFSFAGIPIVSGSAACGSNTTLSLSGQGFSLTGGGTVTGAYAISALANCGPFTSLVNALVAGGGNTLVAKATTG
ncbi:hypothetical protein [Actinokineospora alba]|uniref:hypothetical protein n=1 Tax=Actinokineospora alba TaxID=504798 RepID=UPI000B88DC38|nr:hypothetical protein [Actinokineospora alba]